MKRLSIILVAMMFAIVVSAQSSQPYAKWYGYNKTFDNYTPHSEIQIQAPYNSDVIVIIRYNNKDGRVAGPAILAAVRVALSSYPMEPIRCSSTMASIGRHNWIWEEVSKVVS